jgi:hypothetical protein
MVCFVVCIDIDNTDVYPYSLWVDKLVEIDFIEASHSFEVTENSILNK